MKTKNLLFTNKIKPLSTLIFSCCVIAQVQSQDYISPPMIDIPAGSFEMGNNEGPDYVRPVHLVNVEPFRMAKYSITVAEFRKFAQDTGFNPAANCKDHMDEGWFSPTEDSDNKGSWDKHRFMVSDYQPVTCITWEQAQQYARWLSQKTGRAYRLPTEQEWDYALKANTTSRYFWGDDHDLTQACKYGNFADHTGEYVPSKEYGASYVGFIGHTNCDDGEPYISIVGLYRPNPFGLYDMAGNVHHFNNSCFYEGYEKRSEKEMDITQCEYIAQSGNMWHAVPTVVAERGSYPRVGGKPLSTMGFRLAMDGHGESSDMTTTQFEKALASAQSQRLATRPKLPQAPTHIQLIKAEGNQFELRWQPSEDPNITGYEIYRSTDNFAHFLGGYYKKYYKKIKTVKSTTNRLVVTLPKGQGSYRVVAVSKDITSLPSEPVFVTPKHRINIPGRIMMNDISTLSNALLAKSQRQDNPEPYYIVSYDDGFEQTIVTANFNIDVQKTGWYNMNYRGNSMQEGKFFSVWSGNRLLTNVKYNKAIDDKTSGRHQVYLEKGNHNLELSFVRPGWDIWTLTWLEFNLSDEKNQAL